MSRVIERSKAKLASGAEGEFSPDTIDIEEFRSPDAPLEQWRALLAENCKGDGVTWNLPQLHFEGKGSEYTPLLSWEVGITHHHGANKDPMVLPRVRAAMSYFSCSTCCIQYLAATGGKYFNNKVKAVEATCSGLFKNVATAGDDLYESDQLACLSDFLMFVGTCHPSFDSFILGLHYAGGCGTLPCGNAVGEPGHLSPVVSSPLNVMRNSRSVEFWQCVSGSQHPAYELPQLHLACLQNYGKVETVLVDRLCGLSSEFVSLIPLCFRDVLLQDLYQLTKAAPVEPVHQSLHKLYHCHFGRCSRHLQMAGSKPSPLLMLMSPGDLERFIGVNWSALLTKEKGDAWPVSGLSGDVVQVALEYFAAETGVATNAMEDVDGVLTTVETNEMKIVDNGSGGNPLAKAGLVNQETSFKTPDKATKPSSKSSNKKQRTALQGASRTAKKGERSGGKKTVNKGDGSSVRSRKRKIKDDFVMPDDE